jgi:hypothetical protein
VVVGVDNGDDVYACVGPTLSSLADGGAPSLDLINYISLFKKSIIVTDFADISRPIATVAQE